VFVFGKFSSGIAVGNPNSTTIPVASLYIPI
jgi:hypothetical protein